MRINKLLPIIRANGPVHVERPAPEHLLVYVGTETAFCEITCTIICVGGFSISRDQPIAGLGYVRTLYTELETIYLILPPSDNEPPTSSQNIPKNLESLKCSGKAA